MPSTSQKNINNNEKKIWWTTSRKVALGIGIFLFITLSLFLINDLFFWDIPVEYWITKNKPAIKHNIIYWLLRFTFLTVQINLFFVAALLNYALNKKYSYFARRLLNFAFTYLVFGIFLYWTFVHFELADRFEQFETTLPSYLRSFRLYNYFHVYYSHITTLVFALIAYIFAKKDLIMVKSDIWWSMLYVVIYIIGMFIMWAAKFIPAYQKTTGNYVDKMNAGNEAVKYLYQFINFAKPVFMKNPITYGGNKIVSPSLLWTKAIFLDILLIVCLFAMAPFLMFIWKHLFKIKTFKNVKEYKEFIKIDSNEKLIDLTNKKE